MSHRNAGLSQLQERLDESLYPLVHVSGKVLPRVSSGASPGSGQGCVSTEVVVLAAVCGIYQLA